MSRHDSCADALAAHHRAGRHLCVGLDTDPARLPASFNPSATTADRVVAFNREIIARTAGIACAFKPNAAFYEALGPIGFDVLAQTIIEIRARPPGCR